MRTCILPHCRKQFKPVGLENTCDECSDAEFYNKTCECGAPFTSTDPFEPYCRWCADRYAGADHDDNR